MTKKEILDSEVQEGHRRLIEAAKQKVRLTYQEFAEIAGLNMDNQYERDVMLCIFLQKVNEVDSLDERPFLLTSLVLHKNREGTSRDWGDGFFNLAIKWNMLKKKATEKEKYLFAGEQINKTYNHYSK